MAIAYSLNAPVVAATTGAKTILLAIAPAGHGLEIVSFGISFDGVTQSAVPAVLDIVQSTQAGAGTSTGSPTIQQVRGRTSSGSAPTGGYAYSAEPTVLTAIRTYFIPQLDGVYTEPLPLGRGLECDSSGGTIKAIGFRLNVSASVNVHIWMEVEAVG